MRKETKYSRAADLPFAQLQQLPFRTYHKNSTSPLTYESTLWELAIILFDQPDGSKYNISPSEVHDYEARIRKDQLVKLWRKICREESQKVADETTGLEERALAFLTANQIEKACDALLQGKNYRLATLVAQIGGSTEVRDTISSQVSAWRDLNVLSEMSEPIRAIYSLLAGTTGVCEGKKAQHIEDKARAFAISERFKLDWRRAFGLRLFYGVTADEPLETAVAAYMKDVESEEPAKPEGDALFTLLRLYASKKLSQPLPELDDLLLPKPKFTTTIDPRLSFQLYSAITSWFHWDGNSTIADTALKTFAVQLDATGEWLWAVFVILHIREASDRKHTLQAILRHRAKDIPADPPFNTSETWHVLTKEFKIPTTWIWQAKASYARLGEGDRVREATYLIKASEQVRAHEVLQMVVGPECVIGEEWSQLQGLLEAFKSSKDLIGEWSYGGQLYSEYLRLVLGHNEGEDKIKALKSLLSSLGSLLANLKQGRGQQEDRELFLQKVALEEMSRTVEDEILALREKVY